MSSHIANIFEFIARAGLLARAVVYGLIAALLLAAAIMPGLSENGYSPTESFQKLETETGGQIALVLIGLGLMMYALWRYIQGILDTSDEGDDAKGYVARAGMLSSGTSYLLVGIGAFSVLMGQNSGSGGGTTEKFAEFALGQAFGTILLGIAGLGIIVIGGIQIWRGLSGKWEESLDLPSDKQNVRRAITLAIAGRGLLIGLVGAFLIWAAFVGSADEAKGLSSILGWLRDQPYGLYLYVAAALAIGGYGLYSLVETRYMKVDLNTGDAMTLSGKVT